MRSELDAAALTGWLDVINGETDRRHFGDEQNLRGAVFSRLDLRQHFFAVGADHANCRSARRSANAMFASTTSSRSIFSGLYTTIAVPWRCVFMPDATPSAALVSTAANWFIAITSSFHEKL